MKLQNSLEHVAILGAAGKMGRGIALLWAQMLLEDNTKRDRGSHPKKLTLIDISDQALQELSEYLVAQSTKWAQRNLSLLIELYSPKTSLESQKSDAELIQAYLNDLKLLIHYASTINGAKDAHLIIEAATEDQKLKEKILSQALQVAKPDAFFFTNTSSIPISVLEQIEQGKLKGRVMGLHYYNPPPIQKVVEVVSTPHTDPELINLSHLVCHRQEKIMLPSHDIAGFIGNGYFIREGLFAFHQAMEIQKNLNIKFHQGIFLVNKIYQDYLLRPMGIFQLIDYVGVDVFQLILRVMNHHLGAHEQMLHSPIIDAYREKNIVGGQDKAGNQRDGIFQYGEKGSIVGVFNIETNRYIPITNSEASLDLVSLLGPLPQSYQPWSLMRKESDLSERLNHYLDELSALKNQGQLGATLALDYLNKCRQISQHLKDSGVIDKIEYAKTDLKYGFQHILI